MNRHIIFTNGRSGSNYIANIINQHPNAVNYGEVLGDWTLPYKIHQKIGMGGKSDTEYLEYIYKDKLFFSLAQVYSAISHTRNKEKINFKNWKEIKTIGIKDFSIHFHRRNLEQFLLDNHDLLIINWYRNNSLKRLISLNNMSETGVVKQTKKDNKNKYKIVIDIDSLISSLDIIEKEKEEQLSLINKIEPKRVIQISYEDYFLSPETQKDYTKKIFQFLNLDYGNFQVSFNYHKKILSNSLPEILLNYEQVYNCLKNTRYQCYL